MRSTTRSRTLSYSEPVIAPIHPLGIPTHLQQPDLFSDARAYGVAVGKIFRNRGLIDRRERATFRGWLSRVRRGLYITVSLDAIHPGQWRRDPWVVANVLFAPCYVGGWSAAEHWGLSEQIFADVVVISASDIRRRRQTVKGIRFVVSSIAEKKMFGLQSVWRDNVRVRVSSPARTVADILDNPRLGGAIKHVAEIVTEFITGEHRDDDALIDFGTKLGNKTLFKRLGFIIDEVRLDAPRLRSFCRENVSAGYSRLDPSVGSKGRLLRKWNLAVNVEIGKRGDRA